MNCSDVRQEVKAYNCREVKPENKETAILKSQITQLQTANSNAKLEIETLKSENSGLRKECNSKSSTISSLREQIANLLHENKKLSQAASSNKHNSEYNTWHDVNCDSCGLQIKGYRYKCGNCANFDLCDTCIGSNHNPDHTFLKIKYPVNIDPRIILLPRFPFALTETCVHTEVTCDICGKLPICGIRYQEWFNEDLQEVFWKDVECRVNDIKKILMNKPKDDEKVDVVKKYVKMENILTGDNAVRYLFVLFYYLRYVLQLLSNDAGIFAVFTDTASNISNFSPASKRDRSQKVSSKIFQLFKLFYLIYTIDINADLKKVSIMKDFEYPQYFFMYGRPLWSSLMSPFLDNIKGFESYSITWISLLVEQLILIRKRNIKIISASTGGNVPDPK
ncbi:5877_t:CDS:2 [Dentiscutata heterogama]|uniref:5877_t:CDS:1 n=1 Tax=Dentiscutata heterogama TaxID=1316150 RepID=A0ACA9KQ10_9GLOM|nr:5877_t:CDS:2 [Dentiscutata heterogama]